MGDPVALPPEDAPAYPSPSIVDSRRLMGANRFSRQMGAVLEVEPAAATNGVCDAWIAAVQTLAAMLGWPPPSTHVLSRSDSVQLFLTAPADGLMTATSLAECAWVMATEGEQAVVDVLVRELRRSCNEEAARLASADVVLANARERGVSAAFDDEAVSVGSGEGCTVLPFPSDAALARTVNWSGVYDIPIVLVTGSNGKTTTTRLVAAMWRSAGRTTGWCCSDGVWVVRGRAGTTGESAGHTGPEVESEQTEPLERGDFTGPAGARRVLRDTRVQAAVLETARGGLLRRGLAMSRADVAVITNIAADHFGEYGVASLADLAEVKGVVARVLDGPIRTLVLNAADPSLIAGAFPPDVRVVWFATHDVHGAYARVEAGVAKHGAGCRRLDGQLQLAVSGSWHTLGHVRDFPITLQGAAAHNVENIAAAALAAVAAGVPLSDIASTVHRFGAQDVDNSGRLMVRHVGGVTVVVDYAHNPAGMAALCATASALPAARRLLVLGQAGNRDNVQLRALAASAWSAATFDRVIIKHMADMRRGRAAGEIEAELRTGLLEAGAPLSAIGDAPDELAAVRDALAWAHAGDQLVLGVHVERTGVLQLLDTLSADNWQAGEPVLETGLLPPVLADANRDV